MPLGVGTKADALATRPILFVSDGRVRATIVTRILSGAARDAVNTPTTTLRAGMVLGQVTASKKLVQYDAAATDGSQTIVGILLDDTRVVNENGEDIDQPVRVLMSGDVRASQLLIKGAAFVGHTNEAAARTALKAVGKCFLFDDEIAA
jgi:hypothetical protein